MNTQPIHVFAKWQVKPGHIDIVLAHIKDAAQKSRQEKGNLFYNVHQSTTDANTIVLFEGYTDEAAVAEHRATSHFQDIVIGQIVPLLENREVIVTTPLAN
jgi:quinol monooxygenase YgiN